MASYEITRTSPSTGRWADESIARRTRSETPTLCGVLDGGKLPSESDNRRVALDMRSTRSARRFARSEAFGEGFQPVHEPENQRFLEALEQLVRPSMGARMSPRG